MDDRDFLGYFDKLGSPKVDIIKSASGNIVSTLLTLDSKMGRKASMDSAENKVKQKVEESLRKKYSQGDLGDKMSTDLNYSLKRLVRGLYSENHAVKQGFFLASVMVLNRFGSSIDFEKYMAFVKEETKTNSGMKNPEVHAAMMGRMMCISAMIDSQWVSNAKQAVPVIDALVEIYNTQEFLREGIQLVFVKILKSSFGSVKLFDHIVSKLGLNETKITISSSDLSLFFVLREVYISNFKGQSREHDTLMSFDVVGNKKQLQFVAGLIKQQTYLFPRLHSSAILLVRELFRGSNGKHFPK